MKFYSYEAFQLGCWALDLYFDDRAKSIKFLKMAIVMDNLKERPKEKKYMSTYSFETGYMGCNW